MKFSIAAFASTIAAVVISGLVSLAEGNLTSKRVTMGFVNHGGMWGDLMIMPIVAGFMFPYLVRSPMLVIVSSFLSLAVTLIAHAQWADWFRHDGITGHMFPTHVKGKWYLDLSKAGWMHVLVMTFLTAVVLLYAVSLLPEEVIVTCSLLLTVHFCLSTALPGWYCTGKLWTWRNFGPPLVATGIIWTLAGIKIHAIARGY